MPLLRRCLLSLAWLLAFSAPLANAAAVPSQSWATLAHTAFRHQPHAAMGIGTALAQDHTGFIWLGTQTGLVRWDGFRQRRYLANGAQPGSLPDNYILSLRVDGRGRLWVGTSSSGVARYDAANDRFISIPVGPGGLAHGRISAMSDDGRGGLWLATGGGLEHIRADGTVFPATSGASRIAAARLAKGGIDALLRDRNGGLWMGTRNGMFYRAADTHAPRLVPLGSPDQAQPAVSALYQDSGGRIWVGTRANGAFVLDAANRAARPVLERTGPGSTLRERVFSIVEKRDGIMWIGTEGGGIVEIDTRDGATRRLRHQPDVPDSLLDDDPVAMLRDRSGQIFVATFDALSQHDPRPQGVTTVRSTGRPGKLSITSLAVAPGGRAWLGVPGGAIDIVDPQSGRIQRIDADARAGSLPKGRILAIASAPDGTMLIGTQQGLYRADADGGNLRRIAIPGRSLDAAVWALAWDKRVLWLGGLDGLWALTLDGTPKVLRHEDAGLGDSRVITLLAADDGLWIGTSAGVAHLAGPDAPIERIPTDAADPTRLPPGYVSSLVKDARGRLWSSHFSTGISVLERTDPSGRRWFKRLGVGHGLPDNAVNVLVADRRGQIWMSTDNGLAAIDPLTYRVRRLAGADGVPVQAYWSGAGVRGPGGEILFGGLSGLTVVRPEGLRRTTLQPGVVLTQVTLAGRDLPVAPFNAASARATLTVTAADRERGFALEFGALDFAAPEASRFSYRLQGFDRDWIDTDSGTRRVGYNNLPPGDYTLYLRASATIGEQAVSMALPVHVLPAWHQVWWTRALAVLGAIGMAAALVQARLSLLRRRQRELEAMVDVRTVELRATQAELEKMAYSDALTGLPNRRRFNDEMRRLVAQAEEGGERFNLLLIDLDHFKAVNDTLGHDAGDALLVTVAERLRLAMRDHDCIARLGGDEFAILMSPSLDLVTVERICRRIVASLARPIEFGEHLMQISASVGAATFRPGPAALERTYKAADVALYESKHAGRNGFRISHDEMEAEVVATD